MVTSPSAIADVAHHVELGHRAPELGVDDLFERLVDLVAEAGSIRSYRPRTRVEPVSPDGHEVRAERSALGGPAARENWRVTWPGLIWKNLLRRPRAHRAHRRRRRHRRRADRRAALDRGRRPQHGERPDPRRPRRLRPLPEGRHRPDQVAPPGDAREPDRTEAGRPRDREHLSLGRPGRGQELLPRLRPRPARVRLPPARDRRRATGAARCSATTPRSRCISAPATPST